MRKEKKVLITGVAGFIGSHLAKKFLKEGYKVIGIDNFDPYYPEKYKILRLRDIINHKNFAFYRISFTSSEDLERIIDKSVDGILHIGGKAGVRASLKNPEEYFQVNTLGTLRILDIMRRKGVKKILMASTSSIYANQPAPFIEDKQKEYPISPYAVSKKAAEHLLYVYKHLYSIDAFVVRYFTVYGPAGRPDLSIFKLIYSALSGQNFALYGDGSQRRSFTYIDDVVEATFNLYLRLDGSGFSLFNIGHPDDYPLKYIISIIEQITGKRVNIKKYPKNDADLPITKADISKIKNFIGWQPRVSIYEGLERTIKWTIENWEEIYRIFPSIPKI